jgi:hypothetical protein
MGCPSIMWSMTDAGDRQDAGMAWVTDGRLSRELDEREAAVCRIRSRHPGWRVWGEARHGRMVRDAAAWLRLGRFRVVSARLGCGVTRGSDRPV